MESNFTQKSAVLQNYVEDYAIIFFYLFMKLCTSNQWIFICSYVDTLSKLFYWRNLSNPTAFTYLYDGNEHLLSIHGTEQQLSHKWRVPFACIFLNILVGISHCVRKYVILLLGEVGWFSRSLGKCVTYCGGYREFLSIFIVFHKTWLKSSRRIIHRILIRTFWEVNACRNAAPAVD